MVLDGVCHNYKAHANSVQFGFIVSNVRVCGSVCSLHRKLFVFGVQLVRIILLQFHHGIKITYRHENDIL